VRTKSTLLSVLAIVGLTMLVAPISGIATAQAGNVPAGVAATPRTYSYSFHSDEQGWSADKAEWSPATPEHEMKFVHSLAPLPAGAGSGKGFFFQAQNGSDDVYMFLKRRLEPADGIVPNQRYAVQTSVTFWSDSSADCFGAGGSPGGSVYVKAGASTLEPTVSLDERTNYHVVRLKKGQQGNGGTEAAVIGTVDNGVPCDDDRRWVKVTRSSNTPLEVTANDKGSLWLNVGTDSGYEGLNQLYYSQISTTLTPR
jgi:hypothetical protein